MKRFVPCTGINFTDDENVYRAVWPESKVPDFWKADGSLSYAALRDGNGLSVERAADRPEDAALAQIADRFRGSIVSITVQQCDCVSAIVIPLPTEHSDYHTEIHGSRVSKKLSKTQANFLAQHAVIKIKRDL